MSSVFGDDSRNNWVLALLTFGEGWHNNHHAFQSSARQGFRWWEIDLTFYGLRVLALVGLVWNLKPPPSSIMRNEQKLGTRMLEKSAARLALSFPVGASAVSSSKSVDEARVRSSHDHLPAPERSDEGILAFLPSRTELRIRASIMFAKTRSLDDIVERAHAIIAASWIEAVKKPLSA